MPNSPVADLSFWRCEVCRTPNPSASYLTRCVACGAARPAGALVAPARAPSVPFFRAFDSRGWATAATWAYLAFVGVALILLWGLAERWWPATLALYLPRWVLLLPLPGLLWIARRVGRPKLWRVDAAIGLVIAGPIMGLSLPLGKLWSRPPAGPQLRVMTCNRGPSELKVHRLAQLLDRAKIDVLCLQEVRQDAALEAALRSRGWSSDSGRTIFSRLPMVAELPPASDEYEVYGWWPLRANRVRLRLSDGREIVVASVHLPTMRRGFSLAAAARISALKRYIDWRWKQAAKLAAALDETRGVPVVAAGDFNMPSDSPIMGLLTRTHRDAFRQAGWGYDYTRPSALPWVGLDHILVSAQWTVTRSWVGPDLGSEHLPVIAELRLAPR
jgi:endonuclease/exonuclease/phosphatase family metal-dependent hydrolase